MSMISLHALLILMAHTPSPPLLIMYTIPSIPRHQKTLPRASIAYPASLSCVSIARWCVIILLILILCILLGHFFNNREGRQTGANASRLFAFPISFLKLSSAHDGAQQTWHQPHVLFLAQLSNLCYAFFPTMQIVAHLMLILHHIAFALPAQIQILHICIYYST